jgi:regulator of sigma E protease
MAFAYGDTYIANEDLKVVLLVENKTMQKVGFKTGTTLYLLMVKKL